MGTLVVLAVIVLGVFLGIVLFPLLSMAKKTDQVYERMLHGEEIASPANHLYQPASETLSATSSGEVRPQRDLSASVTAS